MSTLRDHLQAIRDERGALNAQLVVEHARANPDGPLHAFIFDCAPEEASDRYYLGRAAELLRTVKLTGTHQRPRNLRAFVAVFGEDSHRADYVPTEEALADPFTRRLVLAQMNREWRAFKTRYEHMAEFADLVRGKAS